MTPYISDRDALENELREIDKLIASTDKWTLEISRAIIRRDEVQRLIKSLGRKDWF